MDDEAFASIYKGLRRLAAVVAPASADPDDLVQEAITRTLAANRTLAGIDHLDAYLRTTIVRLASAERRRWRRAC